MLHVIGMSLSTIILVVARRPGADLEFEVGGGGMKGGGVRSQ